MPKFTVLGVQKDSTNPIRLTHLLSCDGDISLRDEGPATNFENYELICRKYTADERDVIFAYDHNRDNGCLYLGHWNDGFI